MDIQEEYVNNFNVLDKYKPYDIGGLQEISRNDRLPFSVCAINFIGDLNLGISIRSAHLLGAEKFYIFGRRRYDKRTTVGAHNYIPVIRIWGLISENPDVLDLNQFEQFLKSESLYPIFCEIGGIPLSEFDWGFHLRKAEIERSKICLVFGNEGVGIPKELYQSNSSRIVSIEQRGVVRSYNVSAATSIVAYELSSKMKQLYV